MKTPLGTPYTSGARRALLLGSGELGKEVALELTRLGVEVTACDRYEHAPAMQVAQFSRVFNMLDANALRHAVESVRPDVIIPEVEALATAELEHLEREGWNVVPTARAARLTMDREGIRRLAAEQLNLPTARYIFADTFDEFAQACHSLGFPCVVKPIMSSSGKGQSVVRSADQLAECWATAQHGGRAGAGRVIVEEFIPFESEITLLTVRAVNGTVFCDPIGHRQVDGDYVESWQPHAMNSAQVQESQRIARLITDSLGGLGLFGVELFLLKDGRVLFSEVSPRPHDTGMVTLATQTWSEFALHARAILGLPIMQVHRHSDGASVALKAVSEIAIPKYSGLERAFSLKNTDVRIFGKPNATRGRRMGVVLSTGESASDALKTALEAAKFITIGE
ncbi:MAG: phosphoribosylglycinamide formyltransferase 2 [Pseudomonadota bacterium]|jgi:phosphoribosylglycinamide formyltransferase 2